MCTEGDRSYGNVSLRQRFVARNGINKEKQYFHAFLLKKRTSILNGCFANKLLLGIFLHPTFLRE